MNQKGFVNIIALVVIIIALGSVVTYFALNRQSSLPSGAITNFEECARAGYPVGESYPRQCWTPDGKRFVEAVKQGLPPTPGPITISGEITCLPKKGSGPTTLECAIGLKGLDGRYYGLKNLFKLDPDYKFSRGGLHVEVSGVFSTEQAPEPASPKYDVVGTIDVTSIREIADGSIKSNTDSSPPGSGGGVAGPFIQECGANLHPLPPKTPPTCSGEASPNLFPHSDEANNCYYDTWVCAIGL